MPIKRQNTKIINVNFSQNGLNFSDRFVIYNCQAMKPAYKDNCYEREKIQFGSLLRSRYYPS